MNKKYMKKQIQEAIAYWKKQLKKLNESASYDEILKLKLSSEWLDKDQVIERDNFCKSINVIFRFFDGSDYDSAAEYIGKRSALNKIASEIYG